MSRLRLRNSGEFDCGVQGDLRLVLALLVSSRFVIGGKRAERCHLYFVQLSTDSPAILAILPRDARPKALS